MNELHHNMHMVQRKGCTLPKIVRERIKVEGEQVDESTSADLKQIMEDNDNSILKHHPKESSMYLLDTAEGSPCQEEHERNEMVSVDDRGCLYFRHHSNKAYKVLHEAGLSLPSQRTLRDYTSTPQSEQQDSRAV